MRYDRLIALVRQKQPDVLVEVGVHNGKRAKDLARLSKRYFGFDLWEETTDELNRLEVNGKGTASKAQAQQAVAGTNAELIQGNSRVTLPAFVARGIQVDFAFIDGGHSIETIQSDWDALKQVMKPGGVVVFDDYHLPEQPFGCNRVVEGLRFEVLDGDQNGAFKTHLVKVEC